MTAYYNDNNPYCAQWLRNLIAAGHIAPGEVDERSIKDVAAEDLKDFTQCHFFAGIGGWSLALRMAGWPDDKPVWTGSCPCQPFSSAGQRKGFEDERHLWPDWAWLIYQCRPAVVLGEQVEAGVRSGWFDAVFSDLEEQDYACGLAVLPAAGVGASHGRHRIFYVAHAKGVGFKGARPSVSTTSLRRRFTNQSFAKNVSDTESDGREQRRPEPVESRPAGWLSCSRDAGTPYPHSQSSLGAAESWREHRHWAIEPGMGRVANGVPARMGKLRALGNAIVPQVAAAFIEAAMECLP